MSNETTSCSRLGVWALKTYALICVLAIAFDLSTDRSFGALMLAVLPISLLALSCLAVGICIEGPGSIAALRLWGIGAVIILLITLAFSLLGFEQAKIGELIFTYAALIMALPISLVLPFAEIWLDSSFGNSVTVRIIEAWFICVTAGLLEWKVLGLLCVRIRRQMREM